MCGRRKMMDSDLSTFELALLRTQRDIADTDDEKARLEGEIVRMRSEIARLDQRRVGFVNLGNELKKRLGHEVPEDARRVSQQDDDDVSVSQVSRNAFKGMAPAQAARKYLLEIGHGMSHATLVKALLRGNVKTGSKHSTDAMRTALHRHKEWFVWKKEKGQRGIWELVEWQTGEDRIGAEDTTASRMSGLPQGSPTLSLVSQSNVAVPK
jgi:hypothetical protein